MKIIKQIINEQRETAGWRETRSDNGKEKRTDRAAAREMMYENNYCENGYDNDMRR